MPIPFVPARDDQPLTYLPPMAMHCFSEATKKQAPVHV
jgi:hypothetical protein